MRNVNWTKRMTAAFAGLNRRERIGDGEWADAENLTTEQYPVAMVRRPRKQIYTIGSGGSPVNPLIPTNGTIVDSETCEGSLYLLDDGGFVTAAKDANAYSVNLTSPGTQMAAMGRDLVFQSGAVLHNAADLQNRSIENACARIKGDCSIGVSDSDGNPVNIETTKPTTPTDGQYWYDATAPGLYRWSGTSEEWVPQASSYLTLTWDASDVTEGVGLESLFDGKRRNDAVTLRLARPNNWMDYMKWIMLRVHFLVNGNSLESSYIVETAYTVTQEVDGLTVPDSYKMILRGAFVPYFNSASVEVKRRMPNLDYLCEHANRIWGCRYGLNDAGEFVNEIYGCAPGDPLNWFRYEGTAADSYTASVGSGEAFTGCVGLEEGVVFFKEDRYYFLSGTEPSNFRYKEFSGPGVKAGMHRSVAEIGGALYYLSDRGVMRLTPYGYPVCVSDALGTDGWDGAFATTDGQNYWLCLEKGDRQELYVLDVGRGTWTRETVCCRQGFQNVPERRLTSIEKWKGGVFAVLQEELNHMIAEMWTTNRFLTEQFSVSGSTVGPFDETPVEWHAETGPRGLDDPEQKRLREIRIRLKADEGTLLRISIQLDEDGQWEEILNERRRITGTFEVRHAPQRRCDVYRLKFEGTGSCVIYSITEDTEYGGD